MSNFRATGKVVKISDVETITKKDGSKTWEKITAVIDNNEEYDNLLQIDIFGDKQVKYFRGKVNVGETVNLELVASSRRFEKEGKEMYFTKVGFQGFFYPETKTDANLDDDLSFL